MKSKMLKILSLVCVFALVCSLGMGAFAYEAENYDLDAVYEMARKALDQQEIQNIMSWHVMYHCYGLHKTEMEDLWVNEPENRATASFGQNQGFYVGYDSIWEAYVDGHDSAWLQTAKSYVEAKGIDVTGWTDEEIMDVYGGVGQLLLHVTTTGIIEVAEDGQTAKAFWYSPGIVQETGMNTSAIWEAYGADFVKEDGEWKMWHLHMFTDFMGNFFVTLGGQNTSGVRATPPGSASSEASGEADNDQIEGYSGYGGSKVSSKHDYLYSTQYTEFHHDRLRTDMEIFLPKPYETWDFADGNYGPTKEEYESVGIDLDAWYAAHK